MCTTPTSQDDRYCPLPGEQRLRAGLAEVRSTLAAPLPDTDCHRRAATLLSTMPGHELAAGDLMAAIASVPGIIDPDVQHANDRLHRRFRTAAARDLIPYLPELTDDEAVQHVYRLWDQCGRNEYCHRAEQAFAVTAGKYPALTLPSGVTVNRAAERAAAEQVDKLARQLAAHALTLSDAPSGFTPPVRGEFDIPQAAYFHPWMRARRWLADLVRVDRLRVVDTPMNRRRVFDYDTAVAAESAIEQALDMLVTKILTDSQPTAGSNLDLRLIAGGVSFYGWARKLASRIHQSKLRDARKLEMKATPVDYGVTRDNSDGDAAFSIAAVLASAESRAQLRPDIAVEQLQEQHDLGNGDAEYVVDAAKTRKERRLFGAEQFHSRLGIPLLVPPEDPAERDALAAQFTEDPTLAARSLKAHHDMLSGSTTIDQRWLPEAAIDLWIEFTRDDADRLLGRSEQVAYVVADAALLPLPMLSPAAVDSLLRIVLDSCGHPDWPPVAAKITSSFAAHARCDRGAPTSSFRKALESAATLPGSPFTGDVRFDLLWLRSCAVTALVDVRSAAMFSHQSGASSVPTPQSY